ncbi:hypothetical protein EIN_044370 [Entamoeba invadens IP1]|uniref:Uncharacterized protein n=1 Tax=Entamoeba invadens IP1 TaxID=370355 RepID=A0A0A1TZ99_ENTIV|nr:hypothetical protein EIN_044370 [Entamoeba invadens IP1]ELP86879.1 hypothetical protein EIN_044370 [Entamoeba invadens IP1]|eukprot:XP_004253650.1 hypothetical protein EIN_044370 [Entamoeba invadens IP1]
MQIIVHITNNGTINMSGFPVLQKSGEQYTTHTDNSTLVRANALVQNIDETTKKFSNERPALPQSSVSPNDITKPSWDSLMSSIVSVGTTRSNHRAKTDEQRVKKTAVMEELVNVKKVHHKAHRPEKKEVKEKKQPTFLPSAFLTYTTFSKSQIVWEVPASLINSTLMKYYALMPSMMFIYETDVASFGTYCVDPPLLINGQVLFASKFTVFVIDKKKRFEKRIKISKTEIGKIAKDVVIASANHSITEMSEGFAIYIKNLPPYKNEDIFYQNTYHYIKSITVATFYS